MVDTKLFPCQNTVGGRDGLEQTTLLQEDGYQIVPLLEHNGQGWSRADNSIAKWWIMYEEDYYLLVDFIILD
jgi:hypothetical protein